MKTPIIILAANLILLIGCKKQSEPNVKDISGEWEWIFTQSVYPSDPITPESTGNHETIIFYPYQKWIFIKNLLREDSGSYMLGHGSYLPYAGAGRCIYDSVLFSGPTIINKLWDYYNIFGDTLQFCPGFAGRFASYNSYVFSNGFNGSKFFKKK